MSRFAVLVLAAGRSSRFGDSHQKKPFTSLADRAVWLHSVERFVNREDVCQTIVAVSPEDREAFQRRFGANVAFLGIEVVHGGSQRSDSVRAGLAAVKPEATHVAVHDAARPLVSDKEIDAVFAAAVSDGAAILACPVTSTLKRVVNSRVTATEPREGLWAAQTPQAFRVDLLRRAHEASDAAATDDAQLVERLGEPVSIVEGSQDNLKITTQADLRLAAAILAARPPVNVSSGRNPFADDDLWR